VPRVDRCVLAPAAAGGAKGGGKEADEPRIDMLDIRVGRIVSVQQHPNADALYLEEIDVGEEKPRQVGVAPSG
jgi:tRNA-binding EMAP/Myf-like protein